MQTRGCSYSGSKECRCQGSSYDCCVKGIVEAPDGSDDVVALFLEDDPDTRDVGESAAFTGRGAHVTWLGAVGDLYDNISSPAANSSIGIPALLRCGRISSEVAVFFTDLSSSLCCFLFVRCAAC